MPKKGKKTKKINIILTGMLTEIKQILNDDDDVKQKRVYDWRMGVRCMKPIHNSNKPVLCNVTRYEQSNGCGSLSGLF